MSSGNFNSLQYFPLNFDHRWSMDKHAILAVKKTTNLVFLCEKYIKETLSGQFVCKTTSFRLFFDYNYATQMRHAAFSILPPFSILFEFSVHSTSVYLAKMSSDESSDSEMPYDSSDEEVWEEEEVSGDDDSDGGPGFSDPTRRHSPLSILFEFSVHSTSVYLAKMSSDESSDSEMPYDSSDEEVWEEEEVSGDDDSDGGPGFSDPTRRHSLPGM